MSEFSLSEKLSSGRWILTVISGLGFLVLIIAFVVKGPEHSLASEAIAAILSSVFTSYFHRSRQGDDGNKA